MKYTTKISCALIVAILGTTFVSGMPTSCSLQICTSDRSSHCCCSAPTSMSCCIKGIQKKSNQSKKKCCDHQEQQRRICHCSKHPPQPTVPTAPQQRELTRHLQMMLLIDFSSLCLEAPFTHTACFSDIVPRPISSTALSILFCTWLT